MTPGQLKEQLDQSLEAYRESTQFLVETFEQTHEDEYLTKDDMEEINRLTFYCLYEFKKHIVTFLKTFNR